MELNILGTASLADFTSRDEEYWSMVRRTLTHVFEVDEADAEAQMVDVRRSIGARPLTEQILFRHTDPFDVARRMVRDGNDPPREAEVRRYQEMLGR